MFFNVLSDLLVIPEESNRSGYEYDRCKSILPHTLVESSEDEVENSAEDVPHDPNDDSEW